MRKGIFQGSNQDDVVELVIRDQSGKKIEVRRCPVSDKKSFDKIVRWFKEKYGFDVEIETNWLSTDGDFLKI
jgi:hypothetical protein